MYVKLQSGFLEQVAPETGETPSSLDREALLVYCGNFESMDGLVEVKEEHIVRLHDNHNAMLAQVARMVTGDIPVKNFPPIQLDHSTLAKDTVGRLVGQIRIGDHLVGGIAVKALYGKLRILGKDNVEKVSDGRWTHLSIGADLESGKFQELTITPFPAASDASMLSRMAKKSQKYNGKTIGVESGPGISWYLVVEDIKRGPFQKEEDAWSAAKQIVDSGILEKLSSGGSNMWERLKAFLMRKQNLSAEDAQKKLAEGGKSFDEWAKEEKSEHEKMKKYLTSHKQMSEEDAEKHLSDMNVEDHKKLSSEADEHEKKLAAEKPKEDGHEAGKMDEKKMSAARESLTRLSANFKTSTSAVQLGMKKAKIIARLSKLQGEAKVTPAEVKKLDLSKLSAETDATVEAVLKTYEDREPVIFTGMVGSRKAVDASGAFKQTRMSALEAETRANMPLLAKTAGSKLSKLGKDGVPGKLDEHEDAPHEAVEKLEQVHKEADKHMAKIHAAMDAGNHGEAKDHLRKLMEHYKHHLAAHAAQHAHMGEEPAHKVETEMSALAENFQKMQNDFKEVMTLAGTFVGTEAK